jgi:hypothetical protein
VRQKVGSLVVRILRIVRFCTGPFILLQPPTQPVLLILIIKGKDERGWKKSGHVASHRRNRKSEALERDKRNFSLTVWEHCHDNLKKKDISVHVCMYSYTQICVCIFTSYKSRVVIGRSEILLLMLLLYG